MNTLARGDRLGDWVVDRPLGAGGMGSVYRCHSVLADDVVAAVKVLDRPDGGDFEKRFVQELRTLSNLNHPAIVRVLGGGRHEGQGLLYLAMELIDGEDLHTRLQRGPLPVDDALAVFGPISDALRYAHDSGVAHRDIKPANVMIRRDGRPVIVDFGIAVSSGATRHTREGTVPGTMAYLPPEAFAGELPDPRSTDAYALGVVLWQSLTGEEPFAADPTSTASQQLAQIMGQKLRSDALDPGEQVPQPVRQAVLRTTDPEPDSRLIDLGQVRQMLEQASGSTYEIDLPPVRPRQADRPKRRGGWVRGLMTFALGMTVVAAALVAVVLIAVVAAGAIIWGISTPAPTAHVPRPPVDLATTLAAGADALEAGDLQTALTEAGHALDDHPEDPHANLLYGQVLLASSAGNQARPFFCAAMDAGLGDQVPGSSGLDCARGPGAAAPLVAKLAIARLDQSAAVAALDEDAGDAVASADDVAPPRPARQRTAAPAPPPPAPAAEEVAMESVDAAAPMKSGRADSTAAKRASSPAPRASIVELTAAGGLDRDGLRKALQALLPQLRSCVPTGGGDIKVRFDMGPDGRASRVTIVNTGDANPTAARCVVRVIGRHGFDGALGQGSATVLFRF